MGHRPQGVPSEMTTKPPTKRRRRKGGLLGRLSKTFTDPRRAGGSIDPETGLIDPERGVLLSEVAVAEVGMERDGHGELVLAIEIKGRINTTTEEACILLLASPDAAALLVAQTIALARRGRVAPEFALAFENRMTEAAG